METASSAVIVAIDGPSGTGKSSTSKAVAAKLGLSYLDTGAQYRAITWWMLTNGIDVNSPAEIATAAAKPVIISGTDPTGPTITVDGEDASGPIRTQEVTSKVSAVSAVPEVRTIITELQRSIAAGAVGGIVVEGRDIGTTVLPDADLKIFLTASPEARAARRSGEVKGSDLAATREALILRDAADSGRKTSPRQGGRRRRGGHHRPDPPAGHRVRRHPRRGEADRRVSDATGRPHCAEPRSGEDRHRPDVRAVEAPRARRVARARRRTRHTRGEPLPQHRRTDADGDRTPAGALPDQEGGVRRPLDPFLHGIGQIEVDRTTVDRTAIGHALGVLADGGALGIFPEGTRGEGDFASLRAGLAYFAVRGGRPSSPSPSWEAPSGAGG